MSPTAELPKEGYLKPPGNLVVRRDEEDHQMGRNVSQALASPTFAPAWVLIALLLIPFGPAWGALPELPRVFLDTTYVPPTGATIIVQASGDFQAALNTAQPGDVITLQAGATFAGPFTLPNKTGTGWIIVRTGAPDSSLPPPGTRVDPSHGNVMPKVVVGPGVGGAIQTQSGAHHFRFVGVEFRPVPGSFVTNLVELGSGNETSETALPHDIIFDRCYIHGEPVIGGRRGIALNGKSLAVVDSYLSDFKEVGADSQALLGWNGPGPFKIVNNYLEAAGENVMFGGADPSIPNLVPADIEIRHNYFFKPLSWRIGDPSYAGTAWAVKNLFELKNARRVLIEGNIFNQVWVHAQTGVALLLTVRNQNGTAPWSVVEDVTIRRNIIRHAGAGFNVTGTDNLQPSQQTKRVLIQDILLDDISAANWGAWGRHFLILNSLSTGISDLVIEHVTGFSDTAIAHTGDDPVQAHTGFILRNNIFQKKAYGFAGNGTSEGSSTLNTFYMSPVATKNALIGSNAADWSSYPGNFFPATENDVGFVDFAGGNYRLAASSPYKNAGTDGKDLGADIDAIAAATAGVLAGIPVVLPIAPTGLTVR